MSYGDAIIVDGLRAAELEPARSVVHDAEFGVRLLYQDPHSGAEHYLVRYPAGLVLACTVARPLTRSSSSRAGSPSTTRSSAQAPTVTSRPVKRCSTPPQKATTASSSRFSMVHTTSKPSTDSSSPLAGSASSLRGARVKARTKAPAKNTELGDRCADCGHDLASGPHAESFGPVLLPAGLAKPTRSVTAVLRKERCR